MPLHFVSSFGKAKAIDLLLKRGASILTRVADNAEALAYAIRGEDPGVAIALLAQGADVNATDKYMQSAILVASRRDVRLLLQYGADVSAQDYAEQTPLHPAALLAHKAVLNVLLESSPDISICDHYGYNVLKMASIYGQENVAKILLE